jgi:hypothetical protein
METTLDDQETLVKQEIVSDDDSFDTSSDGGEDGLDIDPNQRKIIWQAKDFSIREFLSMKQDGELELQPEYQRNYVASVQIASRLIESILMDVPIPVIYLAEERNGKFSVIDGQQRLTSFISFVEGLLPNGEEFKLSGLKVLSELNRKSFQHLDRDLQLKIRTTTIHSIIIKKESNEDIKFEIFERLNTGSTKLNEDEIRNTVYRGPYIKLLHELSLNSTFHQLVQKENFRNRMIYRGMILRFLALSERSYLNYKPSMTQFSNKELRDNRSLTDEKAKEYRDRFNHCVDLVKTVFGSQAFRRYMPGNEESPRGSWTVTRINMALFDIQMCGFVNYSKNEVLAKADYIREAMLELMIHNKEFHDSILIQTSDREVVKRRFRIWLEKLDEIIGSNNYTQRTFPFKVKQELFDANPICAISGQRILAIEDAEVDHIVPYSKGGATAIDNAQLVLRYFNRAKSNKVMDN